MLATYAADVRLDRGVDEGGHRPLVLAVLAQHLGADRHHGLGVLAPQDLAHRELVLVVGVRVQEAHADRRDAALAEPAGGGHGVRLVEGADLVALEVHPAADGPHVVGGDDARRLDPEVGVAVAVGHRLAGDLEHELVALGRDEAEPLDLALEQLVRRDGRAVADGGDVVAGGPEHPRIFSMPAMKPSAGLAGVLGVLVETSSPVSSSKATTSVNVPPVSMPTRIRRCLSAMDSIQPAAPVRFRWQYVPTEGRGPGRSRHAAGGPPIPPERRHSNHSRHVVGVGISAFPATVDMRRSIDDQRTDRARVPNPRPWRLDGHGLRTHRRWGRGHRGRGRALHRLTVDPQVGHYFEDISLPTRSGTWS